MDCCLISAVRCLSDVADYRSIGRASLERNRSAMTHSYKRPLNVMRFVVRIGRFVARGGYEPSRSRIMPVVAAPAGVSVTTKGAPLLSSPARPDGVAVAVMPRRAKAVRK